MPFSELNSTELKLASHGLRLQNLPNPATRAAPQPAAASPRIPMQTTIPIAVRQEPPADSETLSKLWREVESLAPDALITQQEAESFIAGTVAEDRLREVEQLLDETPGFARELRRARDEFQSYYTEERMAEIREHFRQQIERDHHGQSAAVGDSQ